MDQAAIQPSHPGMEWVRGREDTTTTSKSLRFHEGMHGTVFIQHIRDNIAQNEFPVFTGELKKRRKMILKRKWRITGKRYWPLIKMIKDAHEKSEQDVDCVGKTIEQYYTEKGKSVESKCKTR